MLLLSDGMNKAKNVSRENKAVSESNICVQAQSTEIDVSIGTIHCK